jgi:biotin carboxyl carrier protein
MSGMKGKVGKREIVWKKAPSARTGEGTVTVDGKDYAVKWKKDDDGVWLELEHGAFGFDLEGELSDEGRMQYLVSGRGTDARWGEVTFTRAGEESLAGASAGGAKKSSRVRAQMPGKIIRILVAEGALVERGQSLAVMEAMKMENEIKAAHPGTVKQIKVKEGQAIETGADLLLIDPA